MSIAQNEKVVCVWHPPNKRGTFDCRGVKRSRLGRIGKPKIKGFKLEQRPLQNRLAPTCTPSKERSNGFLFGCVTWSNITAGQRSSVCALQVDLYPVLWIQPKSMEAASRKGQP
eukprot:6472306-Amphidinium_carterae.1